MQSSTAKKNRCRFFNIRRLVNHIRFTTKQCRSYVVYFINSFDNNWYLVANSPAYKARERSYDFRSSHLQFACFFRTCYSAFLFFIVSDSFWRYRRVPFSFIIAYLVLLKREKEEDEEEIIDWPVWYNYIGDQSPEDI